MTGEQSLNAPGTGASGGVGGASPTVVSSPVIKEVYLIDSFGYKHAIDITIEEYIAAKKKIDITDEYVMEVLKKLASEYLDEVEKFIEKCKEADEAWKDGDEETASKLLSEANNLFVNAQDALIEKLYKLLPIIYNDFYGNGVTIVTADGRSFTVDWENYLRVWKGEDWQVVEVKEL
jgi:hypothetical protein